MINQNILNLYNLDLLPKDHKNYLNEKQSLNPNIIYDIGSNVLHWSREANKVWKNSKIICFDALKEVSFLYKEYEYYNYVLSDKNDETKVFYKSLIYSGGSSIFKENPKINKNADKYFNDENSEIVQTYTLDYVVQKYNLELPDLIKLDVQGSELNILKGAKNTLKNVKDIIIELQDVEYNIDSPKKEEVILYLEEQGFTCVKEKFSDNGFDADYHFKRI